MSKVILEQQTPGGRLQIEPHDDPQFPGFTLYLDGQQVGVFEYNSVADAVRVHVWTGDSESPDATFTLERAA